MFTTESSMILPMMIGIFIVALLLFFIAVELSTFVLFQERFFWLSHYDETTFNEKKPLHQANDTYDNRLLYKHRKYQAIQKTHNPFSGIMSKQFFNYEEVFIKKSWHRYRITWLIKGGEAIYEDLF